MAKRYSTADFIQKAISKHGNRYLYNKSEYKNSRTEVVITCKEHGDFEQRPDLHLRGHGCGMCANDNAALSIDVFISRAKEVHENSEHCYKELRYTKLHEKIKIGCNAHGYFEIKARDYLRGAGCPECITDGTGYSRSYFKKACDRNKKGEGILYVVECSSDTERFYKIGITSRGVADRFGNKDKMPYLFNVVAELLGSAEYIYNLENEIYKMQKSFRYTPNIFFHGRTECFSSITSEVKSLLRIE